MTRVAEAVTRPLRVVFIIDDLSIGGAQRGLSEELLAFDPARVQVHAIALGDPPIPGLVPELRSRGVRVTHVLGHGLLDPIRVLRLTRVLRALRPHVVQTSLDYSNIVGVIAARLAGVPVVASLRSNITQQSRWGGLKNALHNAVIRRGAARVTWVAASAADEAAREYGLPRDRLVSMPNAVDLERLTPALGIDRATKRLDLGIPLEVPLACVTARLDTIKGHRFLLDAVPMLMRRDPPLHFVFVGVGSYGDPAVEQELRAQAVILGVADRVHFVGERPDALEILAASDLFILPSLKEGLSRALLEAMGLGKPVIATDAGGHRDVLADDATGWCVPTASPSALARAIDHALNDPTEADARGAHARTLIQSRFSIQAHVARLEALYREVAGR